MNYTVLRNTITWWEQKRIAFNVFVGIVGLFSVFIFIQHTFTLDDTIGIILWGIVANILYSSGILLEIINQYYLKGRLPIFKLRNTLFIIGTLLYMIVTWIYAFMYYNSMLVVVS